MPLQLNRLRLDQVERALAPHQALSGKRMPSGGWLRAVREALGRTSRVQAERLGINASTLHQSEAAEASGRITLTQLRKLAEGLDCELVYGLVPRESLSATVEAQAERRARQEVLGVAHSMSLEAQRPSAPFVEQQVAQRREDLLAGSWSRLWQ